ncbi:MAG TPA: energy transducer TonB [Opitutaceae bacterium]|jgi:protein TonB
MRRDLIIGLAVSLLAHSGVAYFGEILSHHKKAPPPEDDEPKIQIVQMPPLPPEDQDVQDDNQAQQQPQQFAPPQLADLPSMVTDNSFVQQIQPPPPDNVAINRSATMLPQNLGNFAAGIGRVFDVSQLDRTPQPTIQGPPQYPFEMRRAGISGTVTVDFIVDAQGNVRNAYAVNSTQREFENNAVVAVSKWHFRPGQKGGHAVATHMQVPVVFSLNNSD